MRILESEYFSYKVYGDDKAVAIATRKNVDEDKKYELSVNYATGQIYCRPIENKTCIDLGLEEGQDYGSSSQGVPCNGELNTAWGSDNVEEYISSLGGTCSVSDGNIAYSYCDDGYCEEGSIGENFENSCISHNEGNSCSYSTFNNGIQENSVCSGDNVVNGACVAFNNMLQNRTSDHFIRTCLEINGFECETWGEWQSIFGPSGPIK